MSGNWNQYFASIGACTGSILYDEGFASEMGAWVGDISVKILIPLRDVNESRLPTQAEFERLQPFEDALLAIMQDIGAREVGRVTYDAKRHVFYYSSIFDAEVNDRLSTTAKEHGYDISVGSCVDPQREAYWENLYPTPDDRRVMLDGQVIQHLRSHNDEGAIERPIEHVSIFIDKRQAKAFAEWAKAAGYSVDKQYSAGAIFKKEHVVETHHIGPTYIGTVSKHTLAHFHKAKELGGTYDGWGCGVRKNKAD